MSERAFPAPSTISEQAQSWLAFDVGELAYPAAEDTDGWLAMAAQANQSTAQRFPFSELPVTVEDFEVDGAVGYAARPRGVDDDAVFLWMHPGGLLVGGGDACRATTVRTALSTGMLVWGVDYRLPPLYPYPAALNDAMSVYRHALRERDPSQVFVGGDSAGGNIAAALLLCAKDAGLPMPAALVLNTPQIDLTESGDTFQTLDGVDNVLRSLAPTNALYAAGTDLRDPYLSPIFGDVSGFPRTFLRSGTRDLFLSNTVRMHRKLRAAGVAAELHVFEAMPHGGFGGDSPEDSDAAAEQRRFLGRS
ncbi:alpha/beta hydrolase [Amycolatopsis rubida]|uniref:Acetyl esterase/lipase n=1 Tax=Amycolatopsis rubida TaxID=112413 RepID=A0A1I5WDM0_9PSEU|nr:MULTISPECIES: alpha/beta hydrolase [Amycolatopsis]MYW95224.1 alpha/beta hydrolase fold domain-containing protein [Amycolatopsis rubida]NEC60212.1 alpha/beta hydrolase [Amycolatopsis rubida]OAP28378.1 Monoterpene epsilon-lactone hydrolase [Amycolatopsis sp. M39]SFQ17775.1 Acetyl esterase/lipase [Amycolatopsis rubida]